MRRTAQIKPKTDPVIALINVVFLMLVFFLLAGTIAPPIAQDLTLVSLQDQPGSPPPDALVIHADGHLSWRGQLLRLDTLDVATLAAGQSGTAADQPRIRIVPDRNAPAEVLLEVAETLRRRGATEIFVVTERGF